MKIALGSVAVILLAAAAPAALAQSPPANTGAPTASSSDQQQLADATASIVALQKVCLPLLEGGNVKAVVDAVGLKKKDGQWYLPIEGKRRIVFDLPGGSNPHVCSGTVIFKLGANDAMVAAIDQWTKAQTPQLQPVKVKEQDKGPNYLRTTSTWSGQTAKGSIGLVFSEERTFDNKPVNGDAEQASLLVSLSPL